MYTKNTDLKLTEKKHPTVWSKIVILSIQEIVKNTSHSKGYMLLIKLFYFVFVCAFLKVIIIIR